jgi:hypothetical protein
MPEFTPFELDQVEKLKRAPIAEWQHIVHVNNKAHGFYDGPDANDIDRKLLLAIGEIGEAHGELRAGHCPRDVYYSESDCGPKPEGFGMELADTIIRVFDLAEYWGLDLAALMAEKHLYNVKRPFKHGKRF